MQFKPKFDSFLEELISEQKILLPKLEKNLKNYKQFEKENNLLIKKKK
jgi:hypothetical protein